MTPPRGDELHGDQPPTLERRIAQELEKAVNPASKTNARRRGEIDQRVKELTAESSEVRDTENSMSFGAMLSWFFLKKPSARERAVHLRQAEIQAEMAALRLERSARWKVLKVDIPGRLAVAASTECLAEYELQDRGVAETFGLKVETGAYPDGRRFDIGSWPVCVARHWMSSHLLEALPDRVRATLRPAPVRSYWQISGKDKEFTTEDSIYLPSRAELVLMPDGWGSLDSRRTDFWLRDGVNAHGHTGRRFSGGEEEGARASYRNGIQPLINISLDTVPAALRLLDT